MRDDKSDQKVGREKEGEERGEEEDKRQREWRDG
jgi:hypothetical protein